jgi:hypothetical protein
MIMESMVEDFKNCGYGKIPPAWHGNCYIITHDIRRII